MATQPKNRPIMKNKKVFIAIFAIIFISFAGAVFANSHPHIDPPREIDIIAIINRVIDWMYGLLVVVASAVILYSAFIYLTSGGNPEALKTAKSYILYTVVAIVVAFFARAIVNIVQRLIGA